ncbi:MAG: DUF58 domain-containing protein [Prevotella sp.]|uniref:DUF58 domain-containing protein n=1 Tax=Prevotella sp. TaxID=59823 RepID=UPI002A2A00D2|nr:DUF58 domain-containing protein [Prevotella sp.]MDD7317567.1 DUF58 domain-containing protein [Prevotellaceae bacterium]MDY4020586.1 DUF58 domain-containing protein [Prevotella sp.]
MFLTGRFYLLTTAVILTVAAGYWFAPLFVVGKVMLLLLVVAVLTEIAMLYRRRGITARRSCSDRFSNGDDNIVRIHVDNTFPYKVKIDVVDEIPFVFQRRDISFKAVVKAAESTTIEYRLCPKERGVYGFGSIRTFATVALGLVSRRFTTKAEQDIKVYPSFLMLRRYELLAMNNNLQELGIKRIRRVGHNTDFEQIKEYVQGDDYRTINWKASARRHALMVNVYQDERSQNIYSVIDKGRVMQQAFDGMTLLDYAINAALVLSFVAIRKDDKAGLITFDEKFDTFLPAAKQAGQMEKMMDCLYGQNTSFGETDYFSLCTHLDKHINRRSLLVLYTNFSDIVSMSRQLPYLQQMAHKHVLLVVFFLDKEQQEFINSPARGVEDYYRHVIAEKFEYEKRLIVSTLRQNGIYSLLTEPAQLSVNIINKYLELKARQIIS